MFLAVGLRCGPPSTCTGTPWSTGRERPSHPRPRRPTNANDAGKNRGIYFARYYGGGAEMAAGKKIKTEGVGDKNEKGEKEKNGFKKDLKTHR